MHPNPRASQMDAILRPSDARSPAAYIFVVAQGAAICRGGSKRSIKTDRLSARDCRMVAKIQTSTSKGCHFVRFVGITRGVPIILKPKLALSKGHQSSGMASNRTFE